MPPNRRIFYHYIELEETKAGLWRRLTGDRRKQYVQAASDLMRCPAEFKEAMRSALVQWPKSCEAAFTADAVNHVAFLGHAGCCVATGAPEECTRVAWHTLSRPEQDEANRVASVVLEEWRIQHLARVLRSDDQGSLFGA